MMVQDYVSMLCGCARRQLKSWTRPTAAELTVKVFASAVYVIMISIPAAVSTQQPPQYQLPKVPHAVNCASFQKRFEVTFRLSECRAAETPPCHCKPVHVPEAEPAEVTLQHVQRNETSVQLANFSHLKMDRYMS